MSSISVEAAESVSVQDDERRRFDRAALVVRVDYATVDELFSEFTRDINEGGMQIETDSPRDVGTEVTMHFHLPGSDETLRTRGIVVWVRPPKDGEMGGMGIEFDELTANDRTRINQIVRTLRSD